MTDTNIMSMSERLWSVLLKLPAFIKTPVLRQVVGFPTDVSETLRFKVAETEDELSQAFKLLHDAYVREKLMDPHPSGMRVTKYHALPSTTTLIAIENNIVVGTVSLIRQSAFGIPLRAIFDLSAVPAGARLAEVSALAIKKDHLHQRGRILFPLLKFLFHYSKDYFGVTHFVIAVNPKWIDFYKSILNFKPLSKSVVSNYSFVNGAPAAGGILNLENAAQVYYKIYGSKRKSRNLYSFFMDVPCTNMEFPLRKKSIISDPMLSPELLRHFFIKSTNCMASMTDLEHSVLREMYDHPEYLKWIPEVNIVSLRKKRAGKRFETDLHARLRLPNNRSTHLVIQDVSYQGFGGYTNPQSIDTTIEYKILINIEEVEPCEVKGKFARLNDQGQFGFIISKSCDRWSNFIRNLEMRMQLVTAAANEPSKTGTD